MRRSTSRTYASWIPTIFALLVSVAVIGRWVLTMDGPIRVAAVVLLGALVPIAAVAGAYASQRPLNCRVAELEAALEEEQVARRAHDEIYGRFVNELRAPSPGSTDSRDTSTTRVSPTSQRLKNSSGSSPTTPLRLFGRSRTLPPPPRSKPASTGRFPPPWISAHTLAESSRSSAARESRSASIHNRPSHGAIRRRYGRFSSTWSTSQGKPAQPHSVSTSTNATDSRSSRSPTTGFATIPTSAPLRICSEPPVRYPIGSSQPLSSIREGR